MDLNRPLDSGIAHDRSLIQEPSPPDPSWPRYSSRSVPSYRFVPGLNPHPHRDPAGHSYGEPVSALAPWSPEGWRSLEPWLYGVDLYNFAYWWEAHEVLEQLWHAAGRTSPHARFVQGIIHVSAANLNLHRGNLAASRRQAHRGIQRLSGKAGQIWMGIDVDDFIGQVEDYVTDRASRPALIELTLDRDP
ncbi:MAG: DUF309 domain-containing protein [Gemmatimonadota bacterium]